MRRIAATCLLLFFAGCAAYKELSPKPEIVPREAGYIELSSDKERFQLEQGQMYYIRFPRPEQPNFYLVLKTNLKPALVSYLSNSFDDGAPVSARIADELPGVDSLIVYPVDTRPLAYYWLIDTVRYDAELFLQYRYVPRWRFTYERHSANLHALLTANRTDPTAYNAIGPSTTFSNVDVVRDLAVVEARMKHLQDGKKELDDLAPLFPSDITAKHDTSYENYLLLKSDYVNELTLQENYSSVLRVVDRVQATRGDAAAFLRSVEVYLDFLDHKDRQRPAVVNRVSSLLEERMSEVEPYYDGLLRAKTDVGEFSPTPPVQSALKLYKGLGKQPPQSFVSLVAFTERFNLESAALRSARGKLSEVEQRAKNSPAWGSEEFYSDMISRVSAVKTTLPASTLSQFEGRSQYPCARALTSQMSAAAAEATSLQSLYQAGAAVLGDITIRYWSSAENRLRELVASPEYDGVPAAMSQRADMTTRLDAALFDRVLQATKDRLEAFVTRNQLAIDNVPLLYQDSAFTPVYTLTYSTGGGGQLAQRKRQMDDYLNDARHVRFPGAAIKALYTEFVRDPSNRGVDRARAIVEHGKEYTGPDKQLTSMVSECDVNAAKWIVRAKDYRKVYALPVTSNPKGGNEYMFRVRLQIPTEAEFPVFDVNVKLPREVAEKAGTQSWYRSITIDGKPIKNEGRFRITSPTRDNNYESLISPVQMDKEGRHILEVRFPYPGYRVFEVSTMAQVPIIRKN